MKLIKKFIVLLCVAVLMMPICVVSAAEIDNDFTPGERGTFFAWVWEATSGADNLYQPFVLRNTATSATNRVNYKDGAIPTARKMKEYFDTVPDGKRAVNPFNSLSEGTRAETNAFWYDDIGKYEALMDEIIYYYKRLGGKPIDAVVCDHESQCNVWYQEGNAKNKGLTMDEYYALAETDPRYPELKQSIIDYGIEIYEGNDHPELYNLYAYANTGEINSPVKKYAYMGIQWADDWFMEQCMEKVYQVWKKHYPDIAFSDYGSSVAHQPNKNSSAAGHMYGLFSEPEPMEERKINGGTHVSPNLYLRVDKALEGAPPSEYPYDTYYSTPFNTILLNLVSAQNNVLYLPEADRYFAPWVGSYSWSYNNRGPAAATDYYKEFIYHLGLLGTDYFLFYNYEAGDLGIDDNLVLSELMKDLDHLVGFEDRKALIKDFTPWDSRYILTGMSAGGKNVWRITPDMSTADVTIESFMISDNPLTFRIGQQTVEFPEGSYIYEPNGARQFDYSKAGYWVITPENTEPTEYLDTDEEPTSEPEYLFGGKEEVEERATQIIAALGGNEKEEEKTVSLAASLAEDFKKKFKNTYKTIFSANK